MVLCRRAITAAKHRDGKDATSNESGSLIGEGNTLYLDQEAPATIKKLAEAAYLRWAGQRSSLGQDIVGTPFLEPLVSVCRSSRMPAAVAGSLRALAEGAWATQQRYHNDKLAESPMCAACGEEVGTLFHKFCRCPQQSHNRRSAAAKRFGVEGLEELVLLPPL